MNKLLFLICFLVFNIAVVAQTEDVKPIKVDEFGEYNCEDLWARLDNLAIRMQEKPNTNVYFIFYTGMSYYADYINFKHKGVEISIPTKELPRQGEALSRISWFKNYLAKNRFIQENRISFVDGGYRRQPRVEVWLIPPSGETPKLTPTLTEKDVRFREGTAIKRTICSDEMGL